MRFFAQGVIFLFVVIGPRAARDKTVRFVHSFFFFSFLRCGGFERDSCENATERKQQNANHSAALVLLTM